MQRTNLQVTIIVCVVYLILKSEKLENLFNVLKHTKLKDTKLFFRSVRNNQLVFGGIQVVAAGSFWQLPLVPSLLDPGMFAFQSTDFQKVFPHKIHLKCCS